MSRIARIVTPGLPHHVTQRGNHRAAIFFGDDDYTLYRDLLAAEAQKARVEFWAWCLLPNHVHLILTPTDEVGLAQALARTHRRYAGFVNARLRRTGQLFQERFAFASMDEAHLMAALRYVSLNPVRARLVTRAQDWPWSSVRAHLGLAEDGLTAAAPALARAPNVSELLETEADGPDFAAFRKAEAIGRPLGGADFVASKRGWAGRSRRGSGEEGENGKGVTVTVLRATVLRAQPRSAAGPGARATEAGEEGENGKGVTVTV